MIKKESREVIYKRQIVEYIAYILRTCGAEPPAEQKDWIVIVPNYSDLCNFDLMLGWPIYVVDSLGSFDFMLSVPAEQIASRRWLRTFEERRMEVSFREDSKYEEEQA